VVRRSQERRPAAGRNQWDWQAAGKCHDLAVNDYFPEGIRGQNLYDIEERAKAICRECPVMRRCRQHAMEAPEVHGIWGATTPRERAHWAPSVD
jgi:WhiB family redox-sensing transcriptional regulator